MFDFPGCENISNKNPVKYNANIGYSVINDYFIVESNDVQDPLKEIHIRVGENGAFVVF